MNLRKQFSAALNPKVALNALKGKLTFAQLATKYRIQEGQNSSWRKQAFEGIAGTFSGKAEGADVSQQVDVKKLHAQIGLKSIHQKPKTTMPRPGCRKCKYLFKDAAITRPIQVWCADISYMPMRKGSLYLVAVVAKIENQVTCKVLSWKLSSAMNADFCIDALVKTIAHYGKPDIVNTYQGCQFTSPRFVNVQLDTGA